MYKCLLRVSQLTNLVSMSAGFSSDLTLCVVMILLLTSCCVKGCRSSTCFAFFAVPSLIAIDVAALLFVCPPTLLGVSDT